MNNLLRAEVEKWIAEDPDFKTREQLELWLREENETELRLSFSGFLEFGTAGLRGAIGPGPSRMNRAVVSKTAAGLAAFMKKRGLNSIVVGRDARFGSEDFTFDTAEIMAGAGLKVFILPRPLPTPVLAYALKFLECDAGVMVTASHNPPQDNGYKVYLNGVVDGINYYGSQIMSPTDQEISAEIASVAPLYTLPRLREWTILDENVFESYVAKTSALAPNPSNLKIVYSAMHGVGTETISKVFSAAGFPALILVKEQSEPDPNFPTVAFPNPEEPGAMDLSLALARKIDADLVIANDPDADRCAAAIKDPQSGWRVLRGDEVGALLGDFLGRKGATGQFANSIVSSSILRKIAEHYAIPFTETLTGFKYLSKVENLTFGYEEALGYCVDASHVNDKDGISAALLLAQLAALLKSEGNSLNDRLQEIWSRHGFHGTRQISVRTANLGEIEEILSIFRFSCPREIAGLSVTGIEDLAEPSDGLPPTNGIRLYLDHRIRIIVRPSGTEPKVKCYIEVIETGEPSQAQVRAEVTLGNIEKELRKLLRQS